MIRNLSRSKETPLDFLDSLDIQAEGAAGNLSLEIPRAALDPMHPPESNGGASTACARGSVTARAIRPDRIGSSAARPG